MAFVILKTECKQKWNGKDDAFAVELKKHAKQKLPGFACPEWVKIVDGLPVSANYPNDVTLGLFTRRGVAENIYRKDTEGPAAQDRCETLNGLPLFCMII